jgi:hypothetical protein
MNKPHLVIVLVDALSASYVQPEIMPFLCRLAGEGGQAALSPSPFFAGADPILYGLDTLAMNKFTGYCFDRDGSPYRDLPSINSLDWLPENRPGKLGRYLLARWLLRKKGRSWMPPQFFPSNVLPRLAPAPPVPESAESRHIVHRVEGAGLRAKWYTRDFPFEGRKWLGSQLYMLRHRKDFLQWIFGTGPDGPPDLLLFEWSVLLDRVGHHRGPSLSPQLQSAAQAVDQQLEDIWQRMQEWPGLHWMVISDHGMSEVEQRLNLADLLKEDLWRASRDSWILSSTLAQGWIEDDRLREEAVQALRESGQGEVILPEDFQAYGIPPDSHWGNIVFAMREGTLLLPNHFQGSRVVRGMHGYASSTQDSSQPVAVLWGQDWDCSRLKPGMAMKDLYPAVMGLFGIEQ